MLISGAGCVVLPILMAGMGIGCWFLVIFMQAVIRG
jgi:hypothetical protein